MMNMNIHVVGVHSMNFCSQIVGAVRLKVKWSSYIIVLDDKTINSLPLLQGGLYLQTNQQPPG